MSLITLTKSSNQIISGIPEYIEFSSSIYNRIYYTLDGSQPSTESLVYEGRVYLDKTSTVYLKYFGFDGSSYTDIYEVTFSTDQSEISKSRNIGEEGITNIPFGGEIEESFAYDKDGLESRQSSIKRDSLDLKASTTDRLGIGFEFDTVLDFVNFAKRPDEVEQSGDVYNVNFDPSSSVILIDSFDKNIDDQVVQIAIRPQDSVAISGKAHNLDYQSNFPVTANYVRSFYNPKTKKRVSFYYESLDSRWVESSAKVDVNLNINMSNLRSKNYVYKWISNRNYSLFF